MRSRLTLLASAGLLLPLSSCGNEPPTPLPEPSHADIGEVVPFQDADVHEAMVLMQEDKLREYSDAGNLDARYRLGEILAAQGMKEGIGLMTSAAEHGHLEARFFVGKAILAGLAGFEQDVERAKGLLEGAAADGHGEAAFVLGVSYRYGNGLPVDAELARQWYERAAELDYAAAADELKQLAGP